MPAPLHVPASLFITVGQILWCPATGWLLSIDIMNVYVAVWLSCGVRLFTRYNVYRYEMVLNDKFSYKDRGKQNTIIYVVFQLRLFYIFPYWLFFYSFILLQFYSNAAYTLVIFVNKNFLLTYFRPSGSTAIISILHSITSMLITNPFVVVIALDFSKAFDTVRHHTLLYKLAQMDIPNNVYN